MRYRRAILIGLLMVSGCATAKPAKLTEKSTSTQGPSTQVTRRAERSAEPASAPAGQTTGVSHVTQAPSASIVQTPAPHQHQPRREQNTDQPRRPDVGNRHRPAPKIPDQPDSLSDFGKQALLAEGEPLTLELLESLACQNNPTLLQAQAQVQGNLGKAIQAGLWPNPTLVYIGEQIGVMNTPGEFHGGVVRQRIVTADKLDLSREKYLTRTRIAEWVALAQQYRVLNDVRVHYFRARGRQELLEIQRELLKNAEDNVVTVNEMFNVGQANRPDVHQANVRLQQRRLEVLMAENDYREAFEMLTTLVGLELPPATLGTPLEGDLAPIDWDQALARLLEESPEIMAARMKLAADRITIQREIAETVPDLVFEGGAGYNYEAKETTGTASLAIEVPIFDWNQGTIRQAEADFARQQGELKRTELSLRRELARQYRTYLTALQHVRNFQEVILPESRRAYEILLQSYKDDRVSWPEVLTAEHQYFDLRRQFVTNLIAWRESEALIMGYLLHDGLSAPSTPAPPGHINSVPKPR